MLNGGVHKKYDVPAIIIGTFKFSNKVIDLVASSRDQYLFFEYCKKVKDKTDRLPNGKRRSNYMQLAITKLLKMQSIVVLKLMLLGQALTKTESFGLVIQQI